MIIPIFQCMNPWTQQVLLFSTGNALQICLLKLQESVDILSRTAGSSPWRDRQQAEGLTTFSSVSTFRPSSIRGSLRSKARTGHKSPRMHPRSGREDRAVWPLELHDVDTVFQVLRRGLRYVCLTHQQSCTATTTTSDTWTHTFSSPHSFWSSLVFTLSSSLWSAVNNCIKSQNSK